MIHTPDNNFASRPKALQAYIAPTLAGRAIFIHSHYLNMDYSGNSQLPGKWMRRRTNNQPLFTPIPMQNGNDELIAGVAGSKQCNIWPTLDRSRKDGIEVHLIVFVTRAD